MNAKQRRKHRRATRGLYGIKARDFRRWKAESIELSGALTFEKINATIGRIRDRAGEATRSSGSASTHRQNVTT